MLDKTYQPQTSRRLYRAWEEADAFAAGAPERASAPSHSPSSSRRRT